MGPRDGPCEDYMFTEVINKVFVLKLYSISRDPFS